MRKLARTVAAERSPESMNFNVHRTNSARSRAYLSHASTTKPLPSNAPCTPWSVKLHSASAAFVRTSSAAARSIATRGPIAPAAAIAATSPPAQIKSNHMHAGVSPSAGSNYYVKTSIDSETRRRTHATRGKWAETTHGHAHIRRFAICTTAARTQ